MWTLSPRVLNLVLNMWHRWVDGWRDRWTNRQVKRQRSKWGSQNTFVDHLIQRRISPRAKTAEKRRFVKALQTDGRTNGQTDPLIEIRSWLTHLKIVSKQLSCFICATRGQTPYKINWDFLVACTRLYNPLCLSVGRSVGRSVGQLVTFYFSLWFYFFDLTAPAQMVCWPQIWPLPTRTRLR